MPTIVTPGAPVVTFGQASQMGSNTTNYFGVNIYGANGYYNNVYELSPRSATVSNLFCSIDVAPGTGQTVTFTILTGTSGNGTASPVTCQIAGTSSTSCNDTAHTLSLGQGTGWGMSIATSGSSASIRPRCMVLYQ